MAEHPARIVRFHRSLDPRGGGVVSSLLATTSALQRQHDVSIITRDPDPSHHRPFLDIGAKVSATKRGPAAARSLPPDTDLVIVEGAWDPSSPAVAAWCRRHRVPYLYVPHGSLSAGVRRQFPVKHHKKLAYWLTVERWVAAGAAAVWYASDSEREQAEGTFPGTPATAVVSPFASRSVGAGARPPESGEAVRLVTAARVSPIKDLDVLIRALALPGTDWHLSIAGEEEPRHMEELRTLAMGLGVDDRLHWRGYLPPDELDALFAESHAYVCAGLESFGMSLVEALGANLPVVASDAVALAPCLGAAGATFRRGDVTALGHAVSRTEDRLRGNGVGDAPRRTWRENFSAEAFLAHFTTEALAPLVERR